MKRHTIILFFLCTINNLFPQVEVWGGLGMDLGVPMAKYENGKSILKPKRNYLFNENLYLQVRFLKRIGLEVYAAQNTQQYTYVDKSFYHATGNKYDAVIKSKNNFTSLGANLIYRHPLVGSYAGIYASVGYRMNYTGTQQVAKSATFPLNSQEFNFVSKSHGKGAGLLFEAGCQIITDNEKNMLTFGLQYHHGLTDLYTGQLTALKDNSVQYTDKVTSALSYMGLTLKYHYRLFGYDKSYKIPQNDTEEPVNNTEYVRPEQRKVELKDRIEVKTKMIVIAIYDPYREDNDRVSISINGKYAIQNHTVTKQQYQFEVELYPGVNTLVFQAENLGDIPPNTATIFVIENGKKKKFDMSANLSTSQSLEIVYKP